MICFLPLRPVFSPFNFFQVDFVGFKFLFFVLCYNQALKFGALQSM